MFNKPILKQSARYWMISYFAVLLALGIAVSLEIISFNHNVRVDLTPGKIYSLSDQTIKVLKGLDKDILFTVFYQAGERKKHDEFFRLMSSFTHHIRYRLFDLDRNPNQAKLFGIAAYGQTIAECEGRETVLSSPTEKVVTSAILRLIKFNRREIYFTDGHGEPNLKRDYALLSDTLRGEGWQVEAFNLASGKDIPGRAYVLVVAGPKSDFLDGELEAIERYIQGGGKVIFMMEPLTHLPRVKKFLGKYQIILDNDVVIDKENKLFGSESLAPLIFSEPHPITNSLRSPALFSTTRSVEIENGSGKGSFASYLAKSSPYSWIKKATAEVMKKGNIDFQKGIDRKGPISVAVIVKASGIEGGKTGPEGEIVCFGDSDFVNDKYIGVLANKDLFLNTVEWLFGKKELISIRLKSYEYPFHHMTVRQGKWAFWLPVVIVPGIFLIMGVSVLVYRKWRG